MKGQISDFLHFASTILVLSLFQNSLAADYCPNCCGGYIYSGCETVCYDDPSYNNRCTKCSEYPHTCVQPICGDSCTIDEECFGSYHNDSDSYRCTSCDTSGICVKPGYGTTCTKDETCSGADDGCTKCDKECKLSCSSSNTPLCELLSYERANYLQIFNFK